MLVPDDPTLRRLADQVAAHALARGISVSSAESCTGGLIAHLLTLTPGISAVYPGSVVAYANEAKRDLLRVEQGLLETVGAVSAEVALAMARGVRRSFGADLGIATTGIAGPGGGSERKPVGLTYIALCGSSGEECRDFRFTGDRAENIAAAAWEALTLVFAALSTSGD